MTTKRRKLIAAALAIVPVAALAFWVFSTPQNGVSVISTDKRVKILDLQYYSSSFDYAYPHPWTKARIRCYNVLEKLKLSSLVPSPTFLIFHGGEGPALLVLARIHGVMGSKRVDLLSDDGKPFSVSTADEIAADQFLLQYALYDWMSGRKLPLPLAKNGIYRLRVFGETNDLAVIRIR